MEQCTNYYLKERHNMRQWHAEPAKIEYLECGITNRKSIHNSQQHATFARVLFQLGKINRKSNEMRMKICCFK